MTTLQIKTAKAFVPLLAPSRYKGVWGGRGCVHPDTKIHTEHGLIRICDIDRPMRVLSWNKSSGRFQLSQCGGSFPKGKGYLFRITTQFGEFQSSGHHQILLSTGEYQRVDMLTIGDEINQAQSSHPQTIEEYCQKESFEDDLNLSQIILDSMGHYADECRRYDPQPQEVGDYALFCELQRVGAQEPCHSCSSYHEIQVDKEQTRNHLCLCDDRTCKTNLSDSEQHSFQVEEGHILTSSFECTLGFRQVSLQSQTMQEHHHTTELFSGSAQGQQGFSVDSCVPPSIYKPTVLSCSTPVLSIDRSELSEYWCMQVLDTNNYVSEDGTIHHNSGKSQFFGDLMVEEHLMYPGHRSVCIREVQKTLSESAKRLIEDKIQEYGLEKQGFRILRDRIETPGDGVIIFMGMADHNNESIKSLEGFDRAWFEEAQTASTRSLQLLRPTIRKPGSEIWFSWNPSRKVDAVDVLLRGENLPTDCIVVKANWDDNPWLPDVLNEERLDDQRNFPDSYEHVWEGGYITAQDGAYFAKVLTAAKLEGRVDFVPRDPLMSVYAFWDIGGTGAKADACSIWLCQFIGQKINVLDYYEAQGQELSTHVQWLRDNDYEKAKMYLPHDGVKHDAVFRVSYESALIQAGFFVEILKNAGTGAANQRIEAVRRVFPKIWLDKKKCEGGIEALGWYHEKKDDHRGIGLGPDHDWSSHAADSFGALCLEAERLFAMQGMSTQPAQAQVFNVFD